MDDDELDFEKLLEKSTVKQDLPVSVSGSFPSEEEAQQLWAVVLALVRVFGSVFDLTALDGVTVADDYVAALAALDRGYSGMKAIAPTRDEFGAGFAMAVPVLRQGEHKSHVVLDSALARSLVDPENSFYGFAVHTLCHELAHVYDHMLRVKASPNHYGSMVFDLREASLTQFAMAAWSEYAASRLSADWGTPGYCSGYEQSLTLMLGSLLTRSEKAKEDFMLDRDTNRATTELRSIFEVFLVRASYLLGHIDGLGKALAEEAPGLSADLSRTTWLKALWERYVDVLRAMFDEIDSWDGVQQYQPLKELGEELLYRGGMAYTKLPSGSYFVKFSPTTSL